MRSLASMTGTGDLIGGDTLAGGGAAEAGDSLISFTKMTSSSSLVVAYVPAATMRGAYPLLRFRARVCGVDARAVILRMAAIIT